MRRPIASLPALATFSLLAVMGASNSAFGSSINVDFNVGAGTSGTYVGTALAPDAGTQWNGITAGNGQGGSDAAGQPIALVDSQGNATSAILTIGNFGAFDAAAPSGGSKPAQLDPALMSDIIYDKNTVLANPPNPNSPSPLTFSINGLTPGGHYDLYIYSENGGYANGSTTQFTVNGIQQTVTNPSNGVDPSSFIPGVNYTLYSNLVAAGGTISGTAYSLVSNNFASFNGFQLVQVPEPSSLVLSLLGLSVGGAFGVMRRRTDSCS